MVRVHTGAQNPVDNVAGQVVAPLSPWSHGLTYVLQGDATCEFSDGKLDTRQQHKLSGG